MSGSISGGARARGSRQRLERLLRRLSDISVERAYDPFRDFGWPESIPLDRLWMSEDLLSIHGTLYAAELGDAERRRLSRWELINLFSFNVHGIKELMQTVLSCIYKPGHEAMSEYFHHFLDEENKHMWFFAEFCRRYGGKIYFSPKLRFPAFDDDDVQTFVAFAKILISEQISDFYNTRMAADDSLDAIIRKINRVHHEDESRHIAMGMNVVRLLYEPITENHSPETRERIWSYLARYAWFFLESLYNPNVYKDAGLKRPYDWRRKLIEAPERRDFHRRALSRTSQFFKKSGIGGAEHLWLDPVPRSIQTH